LLGRWGKEGWGQRGREARGFTHVCATFMDGKRIDCGRTAELTNCMGNLLMGKELHRAEESSRQGNPAGSSRERKNNPGRKTE